MSRRQEQIGGQLQAELAELLLREVKHPALVGIMLSITQVEVSADLSRASVHVSLLGADAVHTDTVDTAVMDVDAVEAEVMEALARTEPFLHRTLVKRLRMRRVPRLRFFADHSLAEADRLTHLMREVARSEGRTL